MSDAGPSSSTEREFAITFTSTLRNCVKIPEAMFSSFLNGSTFQSSHVLLSCGVRPDLIWAVELEGRKLSGGWNKFAEGNCFRVGDRLVFQYEGNWRFHVERYRQNMGTTHGDEAPTENEARFVTLRITADKVDRSRMYLRQSFCEANGLYNFAGMSIFMVGKDETKFSVTLKLECFPSVQRLRLGNGLREFLESNDITVNDEITLEILRDGVSVSTLKLRSKVVVVPN